MKPTKNMLHGFSKILLDSDLKFLYKTKTTLETITMIAYQHHFVC